VKQSRCTAASMRGSTARQHFCRGGAFCSRHLLQMMKLKLAALRLGLQTRVLSCRARRRCLWRLLPWCPEGRSLGRDHMYTCEERV